jgi:phosphate acetyltransferase
MYKKLPFLSMLLLLLPSLLFALTADEIIGEMDRLSTFETTYLTGSIQTTDRFGTKTSRFNSWSQGKKDSLIEFTSAAERGQKILRTEGSLYLFYPDAEQLIRMQGAALRQSMLGSDISYEDMTEEKTTLDNYEAADAMVAGVQRTTGEVLVASFQIIKTKAGIKSASSCFIMATNKADLGANGSFIFSDCATIPEPTAEQLAEIAEASADSCKVYLNVEPQIAFLSFSSKGSAKGAMVDKVVEALNILKNKRPDLSADGELQLDAAIIPEVGASKAPGSSVAGKANVLIFPDLNSGNIGYKLVQRLGDAEAYGPILQGFAKPVSDLSRGCSVEDIVVTSAMTLAQAN